MFRDLDKKYIEEFNYETSNIVKISNFEKYYNYEAFFENDSGLCKMCIIPLTYLAEQGKVGFLQIENTIEFFEKIDEDFELYLGINMCRSECDAVQRIHWLLNKEKTGMRKHYMFGFNPTTPIGIVYVYDYKESYKTCNLGIGVLRDYRGEGISYDVIKIVCEQLFRQGIVRIGLEIEEPNISSIRMCEGKLAKLGFEYEGLRRNSYGKGINSRVYSFIN